MSVGNPRGQWTPPVSGAAWQWGWGAAVKCVEDSAVSAPWGGDCLQPDPALLPRLSHTVSEPEPVPQIAAHSPHSPDSADVTCGQWNLTFSRTVSALSGCSRVSDSVRDPPGPSAPRRSGPGSRSPSRRCCRPRPPWPRPAGLPRLRLRCSSTACTAASGPGWGRGLPATVTRGTRRCWRRRWRRWSAASPNTHRATAEVTSRGANVPLTAWII